jgi:hypothetical protein
MSSCCCSYVEMSSEEVMKLAQNCLNRINSSRQRQVDALVQETLDKTMFWDRFFNRIFFWRKSVPPTEEDARCDVMAPGNKFPGTPYEWIMGLYGSQENTATKLLFAARKVKTIRLSTDDLYLLGG